jgi:hypothetical protein
MLSGEERGGERREVDCKFTPNAQEQKKIVIEKVLQFQIVSRCVLGT